MNFGSVWFLLGRLLLVLMMALLVPATLAFFESGAELRAFVITAALAGIVGVLLQAFFRQPAQFSFGRREAFVLVTAAWATASLVGSLPFVLSEPSLSFVDALFESTSGFTTTGATVITQLEQQPRALLLWRSMTHWLGGMGIIVLGIAILPKLAVGGMELLGAEAPGPTQEKLTPRIAQTAKALWGIYALLTLAEALALLGLGMSPFDAVNHAFATMATGGFSTHDNSISYFDNPAIEMVVLLFMILAGANFALHFHLLRGRPGPLLKDGEFRFYLAALFSTTVLMSTDLVAREITGVFEAVRLTLFQSATIITTTGFATADFDAWPPFSRAMLFLLMFLGGCAGSTGGSVKVVRIMIVLRSVWAYLQRLVRPNAIVPVKAGRQILPDDVVSSVTTFFVVFLATFAIGGLILTGLGLDPISGFTASAACLGNVGPGFGVVGPTETYAPLPPAAKIVLLLEMLVGRLELYTVLVLLFLFVKR